MQGIIGVTRIYAKHGAFLLAAGAFLQFAAPPSGAQDKPKRPRITGIDHVRLYVSNINKSGAFYSNVLGLPASAGSCPVAAGSCFSLNGYRQIELEPVPSPAPKNWLAEIAFATDDVAQMRRYFLAHGVTAGEISSDRGGGSHFKVRDPEGNPVAFVQKPAPASDYKTSPNQVSNRFFHAGFVVQNTASENLFYVDLLGFKLYWYGGFKDDGVDWYEIQVPDGPDWIEYMLNIPANADHKELGVQNHFSLGVKDAKAAAAQLRKNGLQTFDGPEVGRDGKNSLDAYDPDATRVEIMEFTPTQKPCCHPYTAPHPTP